MSYKYYNAKNPQYIFEVVMLKDIITSSLFGFTIFCCLRVLAENAVEVFLLILSNLYLVFSGFSWVSFVQCEKKENI